MLQTVGQSILQLACLPPLPHPTQGEFFVYSLRRDGRFFSPLFVLRGVFLCCEPFPQVYAIAACHQVLFLRTERRKLYSLSPWAKTLTWLAVDGP